MVDKAHSSPLVRAEKFIKRLGIRLPILLAPMVGACPPSLSIAVANAGGLGACGALMMKPDEIRAWSERPAPYPVQRGLTRAMREAAQKAGDADRMQVWAGQSAKLARDQPAGVLCQRLWEDASRLLS